mmetsp:Transcript_8420/g.12548  ORF Transcript_8420/g.12548 Transcript_8420/m.12548 type:complete len:228 (+) Transcript_8420:864-1547(+)
MHLVGGVRIQLLAAEVHQHLSDAARPFSSGFGGIAVAPRPPQRRQRLAGTVCLTDSRQQPTALLPNGHRGLEDAHVGDLEQPSRGVLGLGRTAEWPVQSTHFDPLHQTSAWSCGFLAVSMATGRGGVVVHLLDDPGALVQIVGDGLQLFMQRRPRGRKIRALVGHLLQWRTGDDNPTCVGAEGIVDGLHAAEVPAAQDRGAQRGQAGQRPGLVHQPHHRVMLGDEAL